MATLEEAIRTVLIANAPLVAIVGTRIYPLRAPDNPTAPFITYQRISSSPEHTLDTPGNLKFTSLQIDCWTSREGGYLQAKDLALKLQGILNGLRGNFSGVDVQGVLLENDLEQWDPGIEVYRVTQSYRVIHREG